MIIALLLLAFTGFIYWRTSALRPGHWRSISRGAAFCGTIYLGLLVVLMFLENFFIYHPVKHTSSWYAPKELAAEDVWVKSSDGTRIHAWWCPVKSTSSESPWVVLYCHGNAGNLSHRGDLIHACWQQGMQASVLIFDYPGYGRSEGRPSEQGCYAAAEAAYEWLRTERKVPADRLLLFGSSLGGSIALDLALRKEHRALVLLSTFTSIPDMAQELFPFLPCRWVVRTQCDNLCKIAQYDGAVLIAHGTADTVVPFRHSERLFEAATAARTRYFHRMPGIGHQDSADLDFYEVLKRFLADSSPRSGRHHNMYSAPVSKGS